jgi:aminoglycoside phosphotransferase
MCRGIGRTSPSTGIAPGHYLSAALSTPEIYGWDKDGDDVFLYMQLVFGVTLNQR